MKSYAVYALALIGSLGMIVKTVTFVRITLPENFGSNPGFGAYEVSMAPWWGALCLAFGLYTGRVLVPVVVFVVGLFGLGLVAQLLGRVFGRES